MKKISCIIFGTMLIFIIASCTKLKEPFIIEPIVAQSDTINLTESDTINFDGKIVVLLEDYTGVKCNNCPAAGALALELQQQNEDHLIVLGVHPKDVFQNPSGGFHDFRTDDGTKWKDEFNISSYPNGVVNRIGGALNMNEWTSAVNEIIGNDAPVRLVVKTDYNDDTRELRLSIHSKFIQTVESNDVRLTVCMMEDSIVGKQATQDSTLLSYMHRHVFRGTADGITWGSKLNDEEENIGEGRNFITNMKFNVKEDYNADQFYIVAFISDHNTKEILMATEKKIK